MPVVSAARRIMVATEVVEDAGLVAKLLRDEFADVVVSCDPERSVRDFEKHQPAILVLAFNTLEKAERYYLGLYRLSTAIHALPHRTLILCNKDDLTRVYALCKKEYFDDYILFWPMAHDAMRLPMAVHHALRQMADAGAGVSTSAEFATQARRVAGLESVLAHSLSQGDAHIDDADRSLARAEQGIDAALENFSRLADGSRPDLMEVRDQAGLAREIARLRAETFGQHLRCVAAAVQPVRQWVSTLKEDIAPQLESARALQAMVKHIRPVILVVDDDEMQRNLLAQQLAQTDIALVFAASAVEGLSLLRKHRPGLILMDINLPDIDGVEVTRRLKAVEQFAHIPVIMMTGRSGKEVVVDSLKAGATDFVVKPLDRDILLTKLRKLLA